VALIDGEVTDRQFAPERFTETGIVSFLQGVKVERNDELSALYAEAVANIVHVNLADGRTLTKRVDYPLGNAKNRLKDSEVEGKFVNLAAPKIGKEAADGVLKICWKFDEARDAADLMKALVMPAT
jgi:2-methylcitrate dehydratase